MIVVPGVQGEPVSARPEMRRLRVHRPRLPRRLVVGTSTTTPPAAFVTHLDSDYNLVRAMNDRVLSYKGRPVVTPDEGTVVHLLSGFVRRFKRFTFPVATSTRERFLSSYTGRKRNVYTTAFVQLDHDPLTQRDAVVSTFIKAEKFDYLAKPDACPRAIQPRNPRYLASVGLFIKPIEKLIYKQMARCFYGNHPVVMKGFNACDTAKLLREKFEMFDDPIIICLDASRFDLHVSQPLLRFTHRVYAMFNNDPEFQRLLSWTLVNRGYAKCSESTYKYQVAGRRMSGDMDTSLGNCLIMVAICWSFMSRSGNTVRHQLANNGDDCAIICNKADAPRDSDIKEYFQRLGFIVRVESRVSTFERFEFCQTRPVKRADGWVMVRNISAIAKDVVHVGDAPAYPKWLYGIGECGGRLADGIPIFSSFYALLRRIGVKSSKFDRSVDWSCGMVNLAHGMVRRDLAITPECRVSFYDAFGISPQMQVAIENYYSGLGPLGKVQRWQINDYVTFRESARWFVDELDNHSDQTVS